MMLVMMMMLIMLLVGWAGVRMQVSLFVPHMAEALHVGNKDVQGRIEVATKSSIVVGVSLATPLAVTIRGPTW